MSDRIHVGLDIGTGGIRGIAITNAGIALAQAEERIASRHRRYPRRVLNAAKAVLSQLSRQTGGVCHALCVAGTSGSIVALDGKGQPVAPISLYCDKPTAAATRSVPSTWSDDADASISPDVVARMLDLIAETRTATLTFEATFVASALAGRPLPTDFNNALKAGGQACRGSWSATLDDLGIKSAQLPALVDPGTPLCPMARDTARELGFRMPPRLVAGTTDGCASALSAGLLDSGDAVTSLGTTLTLKILADRPIASPAQGIYSHRLLGRWLVGGASNAGGAILRHMFSKSDLERLSNIPVAPVRHPYRFVPLVTAGERFPVVDPGLEPCLTPRPRDRKTFFQAILDSLTAWERAGYYALVAAGAPEVRRLTAVGGGTRNAAWMATRRRDIHASHFQPDAADPAFGAARLARISMGIADRL